MTYRQIIETFTIVAKYNGGIDNECFQIWARRGVYGIIFNETPSADDLRKLSKMEWLLGNDTDLDDNDAEKWQNSDKLSDEELIALFEIYNGIFTVE